ncbi:MAG: hypothetical protein ACKO3K_09820 [Cuspidothrix sp.]
MTESTDATDLVQNIVSQKWLFLTLPVSMYLDKFYCDGYNEIYL